MPEHGPAAAAPEAVEAEVVGLRARVAEQEAQVAQFLAHIQEPEARSLRQRKGRKPGEQKGHPGATRELLDGSERTVVVPLAGRCACKQVHCSTWPAGVQAPVSLWAGGPPWRCR